MVSVTTSASTCMYSTTGYFVFIVFKGNEISYNDQCRIKHVLTQQYLAVTQRGHQECHSVSCDFHVHCM